MHGPDRAKGCRPESALFIMAALAKPGLIYNDRVMMIRFSSVFLLSL